MTTVTPLLLLRWWRASLLLLLVLYWLLPTSAHAQPAYQWARGAHPASISPSPIVPITAIAPSGEVYTAYSHRTPLTVSPLHNIPVFGGISSPDANMALVRYDAAGNVTGLLLNGGNVGNITDLVVDPAGNIYATGNYTRLQTGITVLTAPAPGNLFVAKWNAAGTRQWVATGNQQLPSLASYNAPLGLDVGPAGNVTFVFTTKSYRPTSFQFDSLTLTGNLFCIQLDSAGTVRWGSSAVEDSVQWWRNSLGCTDMATDPTTGDVLLTGISSTAYTWAGTRISGGSYWVRLNAADGTVRHHFSYVIPFDGSYPPHSQIAAADNGYS